jgi:hypothetical protein
MALTSYAYTNDVGTCSYRTVNIQNTDGSSTSDLIPTNTGSSWSVEPADYYTVQDHTFQVIVSGTDGVGDPVV